MQLLQGLEDWGDGAGLPDACLPSSDEMMVSAQNPREQGFELSNRTAQLAFWW